MNKKLIAVAVAGVLAAPLAAQADTTIYGHMHYSWDFIGVSHGQTGDTSDDATGVSRASRLGFKGSEDLGDGLTAVYQIESSLDGAGGKAGQIGARDTFVGLSGGFGTVIAGRHDTPYKMSTGSLDLFADTIADYNNIISRVVTTASTGTGAATANRFDQRAPQTVAYVSPNMNGVTAAIARVSTAVNEGSGNKETNAWSGMVNYANGPIYAAVAYEVETDGAGALGSAGFGLGSTVTGVDKSHATKVGFGYTMGAAKVGVVWEKTSANVSTVSERKAWMLNGAYTMGNNVLKLQYVKAGDGNVTSSTGAKEITLGVDHNFSKRTKLYALYTSLKNDDYAAYDLTRGNDTGAGLGTMQGGADPHAFSVGIIHNF